MCYLYIEILTISHMGAPELQAVQNNHKLQYSINGQHTRDSENINTYCKLSMPRVKTDNSVHLHLRGDSTDICTI